MKRNEYEDEPDSAPRGGGGRGVANLAALGGGMYSGSAPPPAPMPAPEPDRAPARKSGGMAAPVESDSDDDRGNIFEEQAPQGPVAGAVGSGPVNNDEEVSDPNARSAAPAGEDRRFKRLVGAAAG